MLIYPASEYMLIGAPQAPNAQPEIQYLQLAHAAQTVPPGFSYRPHMWFTPNMPASIAPEASRLASQVAPLAIDPARPVDYQLLDDIIRVIEGFSSFGIDARDLCLVPNVVLPQKFKVPDLPKYKGLICPRNHLTMYCRKMASHIDNDNLLIHCFQDSLVGACVVRMMGRRCCCGKTASVTILFFDGFWQVNTWMRVCMQKDLICTFIIIIIIKGTIPGNPRVYSFNTSNYKANKERQFMKPVIEKLFYSISIKQNTSTSRKCPSATRRSH